MRRGKVCWGSMIPAGMQHLSLPKSIISGCYCSRSYRFEAEQVHYWQIAAYASKGDMAGHPTMHNGGPSVSSSIGESFPAFLPWLWLY